MHESTIACCSRERETWKSDICWFNESVLRKSREICFSFREQHEEGRVIFPLDELIGWGYLSSIETWSWFETLWWFDTESSEDCGITVILVTAPAYTWKQQSRWCEIGDCIRRYVWYFLLVYIRILSNESIQIWVLYRRLHVVLSLTCNSLIWWGYGWEIYLVTTKYRANKGKLKITSYVVWKIQNPSEEQALSTEKRNKRQNNYTYLFDGWISGWSPSWLHPTCRWCSPQMQISGLIHWRPMQLWLHCMDDGNLKWLHCPNILIKVCTNSQEKYRGSQFNSQWSLHLSAYVCQYLSKICSTFSEVSKYGFQSQRT